MSSSANRGGSSADSPNPSANEGSPSLNAPIPALLRAARRGDEQAFDDLYGYVYDELRRLARVVRGGRAGETLNTTALVHEAYLHLLPSANHSWQDKAHFLRVAARAMRQVLVHEARHRRAQKRGGDALHVTLHDVEHTKPITIDEMLTLEDALARLDEVDPRKARVVECRFFVGMSVEETAEVLGVGSATVKRDWRMARAFLTQALRE